MENKLLGEAKLLSLEEQAKRLFNVAIKDPDHLKRWLEATGRRWLIFDTLELVDSLPYPEGLDYLMQIIACYRDYRRAIPSGRTETIIEPTLGKTVERMIYKDETLEVAELDRAIRYLVRAITERDSKWTLEQAPL